RRDGQESCRHAAQSDSHDPPAPVRARHPAGTDLSGLHVDAQHPVPQVEARMAKTKTKPNPFQMFEDALRAKQRQLLDSYERDKAAGNALPDDGIQDLADKAASAYSKELNFSLSDTERNLLMSIEEAFNRMRDGAHGTCTNC